MKIVSSKCRLQSINLAKTPYLLFSQNGSKSKHTTSNAVLLDTTPCQYSSFDSLTCGFMTLLRSSSIPQQNLFKPKVSSKKPFKFQSTFLTQQPSQTQSVDSAPVSIPETKFNKQPQTSKKKKETKKWRRHKHDEGHSKNMGIWFYHMLE